MTFVDFKQLAIFVIKQIPSFIKPLFMFSIDFFKIVVLKTSDLHFYILNLKYYGD